VIRSQCHKVVLVELKGNGHDDDGDGDSGDDVDDDIHTPTHTRLPEDASYHVGATSGMIQSVPMPQSNGCSLTDRVMG
jgi:hypothetical protein